MTYLYETIPAREGDPLQQYEIKQSASEAPLSRHPETGTHPSRNPWRLGRVHRQGRKARRVRWQMRLRPGRVLLKGTAPP